MRFNAVLNSVDPATREEIERLHAVVDEFAIEMKARSVEQAMKGLRGWSQKENYRSFFTTPRSGSVSGETRGRCRQYRDDSVVSEPPAQRCVMSEVRVASIRIVPGLEHPDQIAQEARVIDFLA